MILSTEEYNDDDIENSSENEQEMSQEKEDSVEDDDEDEDEDDVVKAIKAAKNKPRDHPPSINSDDFIVDISFHPSRNILALANILGDVILYEYTNDETKIVNTFELHLKACRDIEFNDDGDTLFSTAKVGK